MRITFHLLFVTACVLADKDEDRKSKLPFVADAVGNALPPPSSVPASVGSPVNLLTPDRYEFYTFDESGELVKRLMTLEEIQAIVAAGEEGNSMVTFANDDQPTVAFNFSQPPSTKVHSVVTNVQNVLKAQMEAHKNKPLVQPTLDTPDVSDSWSLILPSIFGNTGVDIVPDKSSGSFTTPETETLEIDDNNYLEDGTLSKEGDQKINTTTTQQEIKVDVTEKSVMDTNKVKDDITTVYETSSTSTIVSSTPTKISLPSSSTTVLSKKPSSSTLVMTDSTTIATPRSTTTVKPSTTTTSTTSTTTIPTTPKLRTTSTTSTTTIPTTAKLRTTSTTSTTTTSTTAKPKTTSNKSTTTTSTTAKPKTTSTTSTTTTSTTPKPTITKVIPSTTFKITATTFKPEFSTKNHFSNVQLNSDNIKNDISDTTTSSEKDTVFEKFSTFIPVSTVKYVTERSTHKPSTTTHPILITEIPITPSKKPNIQATTNIVSTLPQVSSTVQESELEKMNATTITTQSVSLSTSASSTEISAVGNTNSFNNIMENKPVVDNNINSEINEPLIPLFDVAQSISQIASDLGGDFQPLPTVTNLLDTTQMLEENFESKENTNMAISTANEDDTKSEINNESKNEDNFVKISTLDPQHEKQEEQLHIKEIIKPNVTEAIPESSIEIETTTTFVESTTLDPFLNESMDDLISQVVNEAPQHYLDSESSDNISTTERNTEAITESKLNSETISEIFVENNTNTKDTTEKLLEEEFTTYKTTFGNEITTEEAVIENIKKEHLIPNINDIDNSNLKEYIQISVSDNDSGLETATGIFEENEFATDIPINDEDNESNYVKDNIDNNDFLNLETTTIQLELTTRSSTIGNTNVISTINPENFNSEKEIINIKSDEGNTKKQDNSANLAPKIEEFKKKIQKVNIAEEELENIPNNSWKRIPTVSQIKNHGVKDKVKAENHHTPDHTEDKDIVLDYSKENQGLEVTTKDLSEDVEQFTELCNELAFRYWNVMTENVDKKRSFVMSPYSITSMLAMMFMGARGATSGEMNEILKLDEMVTFNPHFTLKNISDSIEMHQGSGIAVSAFIRELYSDRNKGKILTFYKERAQHFYNGHVEEINFKLISDIIRRRTNLLVKRYTWGKISEYLKTNTIVMQPPLAAFSANIFQTDCTGSSVGGRDGEMYFVVSPNVRQRRLVPVPAVVYKNNFLAGYDPVLDATAAALGNTNSVVSTLFVMPGQQGNAVHPEDLEKLEQRLIDASLTTPAWKRLLRTLLPRIGLELQIPRFSHKSVSNVSSSLRKMGLKDLFDAENADLGGLNGPSKDLYLSDMVQMTNFVTCGEDVIGDQHHVEEYPESLPAQRRRTSRWTSYWDEPRDYQRAFHDPHDAGEAMNLPLHLRPRQARVPSRNVQPARLKFDRPFLYFTRHNPTGMILYVGRYNPRLLP